jgi:hypothetical protein
VNARAPRKTLRALDWAFEQTQLRAPVRLLLLCMGKVGNSSLHSFMTMETMVKFTGMDERTIRRAIKELLEANLIIRCVDKLRYGKRLHQYRLLVTGANFGSADPPILPARTVKSAPQNPLPESGIESAIADRDEGPPKGLMTPAAARSAGFCLPPHIRALVGVDLSRMAQK